MPLLERMATLLEYPGEQTGADLDAALADLREVCPAAAERLSGWESMLREQPVSSVQELYAQTFDLNPVCSLDVGYYLFGEDYQRGLFLAHLREEQEEVGMTGERELPDHLPVLLRWLARVYGTELYTEMVAECLVPVLRRMDQALTDGGNPYRGVLQAVSHLLERDLAERGIEPADRRVKDPRSEFAFRMPDTEEACVGGL